MSDASTPVRRQWTADLLGVLAVVAAAVAVLAPALRPGVSLGPFDLLSRVGLTHRPGVRIHTAFPADQVLYFLPMTNVAWHQVHAGHLPLWNPYNVLGTPLAFNWQSGVWSVPNLVGYLVPLRYAYTAIVLVKLLIAGGGAYFLCRVLRLRPLAAAFGGIAFELSGPMVHYSGWAMTSVTAWSGWIIGLGVLLVRGRHRARHGALLALAAALAVYGGHPESVLVTGVSCAVFFAVLLAARARWAGGALRRPVVDLAVAGVGAVALAAPLVLPGIQVAGLSSRASSGGAAAFGLGHLADLTASLQGTDFRVPPPYLGVITLALAAVGLRMAWRRAEVLALGVTAGVALLLCFHTPLYAVLQGIPSLKSITWNRDVMLLALVVAVLGAHGLEHLADAAARRRVLRAATVALAVVALIVVIAAVAVAGGALHVQGGRAAAFAWPAAEAAGGLVVLGMLARLERRRPAAASPHRWRAAGALLALQAAALVGSGVSFWSLSDRYFPSTPAVGALQHLVGDTLVARGSCRPLPFTRDSGAETGIRPNANMAYGVREFAAYEPILPHFYYRSWASVAGGHFPRYLQRVGVFCPEVATATEARVYGVSYILTGADAPAPKDTVAVGTIGGEHVFRVPGAAEATLVDPGAGEPVPSDAPGAPVAVRHPDDASWKMTVDAPGRRLLRLRLTALPGWQATVDGRPVPLRHWAKGALLEARIPPGHHTVSVRYWPPLFTAGLGLAAGAVALFAGAVVAARMAARRPGRVPAPTTGAGEHDV